MTVVIRSDWLVRGTHLHEVCHHASSMCTVQTDLQKHFPSLPVPGCVPDSCYTDRHKKHLLPLFCCAFREEFRTKASYCMVSHVTTAFIYSQCRTPYLAETFPTPGTSGSDRIDRRCACAGWWRNFRSICTSIRRSPPDPGERISTNRQTYIIHQQSIDHHTASNWSRNLSKWHAVTNVNNILKYVGKICHYYMFVVLYRNNKRFTWFFSVSVAKSNDTECKTSNHATNNNSKFTR